MVLVERFSKHKNNVFAKAITYGAYGIRTSPSKSRVLFHLMKKRENTRIKKKTEKSELFCFSLSFVLCNEQTTNKYQSQGIYPILRRETE